MKQYLVSLISEQTIPNILFIKSVSNIDAYIFISTKRMQQQGTLSWILSVCPEIKQLQELVVNEASFTDIQHSMEDFLHAMPGEASFVLNLTGGNKLMALAAYECFRSRQSHIFYLPPLQNMIQQLYPIANAKFRDIEVQLSPKDFFAAYGMELEAANTEPMAVGFLDRMFGYFARSANPDYQDLLSKLGSKAESPELLVLAQEIAGVIGISQKQLNEPFWRSFVKGTWFEEYLASHLKQADPKIQILSNCMLQKANIKNEIDLAFTYHNRLYIVEAKASAKSKDITQFLYKLEAVNSDFGLFPKSLLAVASAESERMFKRSGIPRLRAGKMGITLLTYNDLQPENISRSIQRFLE